MKKPFLINVRYVYKKSGYEDMGDLDGAAASHKKYRRSDLGKKMAKKARMRRRAKVNDTKETFTMDEWFKKVDGTNGICPGYKREPHFVGKEKLTLDHIIPISKAPKGFIYTINDIQPLCHSCNSRKGAN